MVIALVFLAAVASTPTPTPTSTPSPRPTIATMTAPMPGANSETYGKKIPLQLRDSATAMAGAEPTPTMPPNSLAAVAAKIKINREALAEMPRSAPPAKPGATALPGRAIDFPVANELAIKEDCAREWPSDYSMQAYCVDKQISAVKTLQARVVPDMPPEVFDKIRKKCKEEWPHDYAMQDYCETKQVNAWRSLQQR